MGGFYLWINSLGRFYFTTFFFFDLSPLSDLVRFDAAGME